MCKGSEGTRSVLVSFGLAALAMMFPQVGHATLLNPGDNIICPCPETMPAGSTFVTSSGQQIKTIVGSTPFNPLSVTFETDVYREASGTLDFYYQFSIKGGRPNARSKVALSIGDFTGFSTDAGFVSFPLSGFGTGTRKPAEMDRSTDGSTIDFFFLPGLSNGQTSFTLLVETDATLYNATTAKVQDYSNAVFDAFEPMATPEPASIVLFGTVLTLTGLVVRSKFARKQ